MQLLVRKRKKGTKDGGPHTSKPSNTWPALYARPSQAKTVLLSWMLLITNRRERNRDGEGNATVCTSTTNIPHTRRASLAKEC